MKIMIIPLGVISSGRTHDGGNSISFSVASTLGYSKE
jgi:hypothetical protein